MAHTNSWDETQPTDATAATSIDDEIRKLRIDARERLAVDHNLTASDAGADTVGYHKQITFEDDITDPTVSGDVSKMYPKKLSTGSVVVPFFRSTNAGVARILLGDANFKVWLYAGTAPVGMKASSSPPSDCVLAGVGGSYPTAGSTAGQWQINSISNHAAHNHQWHIVSSGCYTWDSNGASYKSIATAHFQERGGLVNSVQSADERTPSDSYPTEGAFYTKLNTEQSHTIGSGWRPYAAVCKLFEPDLTV